MCEYCEGKEDISNKEFEDGSKFSDYICKVNIENIFNEKMLIVRPVKYENGKRLQYEKYCFNINYCPMCRKKIEYRIITSDSGSRKECRYASQ